jgi:thiosulfate/3-mercaptopyruvate sulfurtransferase
VTSFSQILTTKSKIVDARPSARFHGKAPEPRPIISGHIAKSLSIPFTIIATDTGELKSADELKKIFEGVKVDEDVICMCGSGVTACCLYFAMEQIGYKKLSVYDGSWAEYVSKGGEVESKGPKGSGSLK